MGYSGTGFSGVLFNKLFTGECDMFSNSPNAFLKEEQDTINRLKEIYRGLKETDLDLLNPSYSCVICADTSCDNHNKPGCCCENHKYVEESDWSRFYNFEV